MDYHSLILNMRRRVESSFCGGHVKSRVRGGALVLLACMLSAATGVAQLHHFKVEASGGGNIGRQRAGILFAIKITAQQANNTTFTSFTGKAKITSSGTLTAGGDSTAKFVSGVLASHSVAIGTTGLVTITATRDSSGTSNAFPVVSFRSDDFNAFNLNPGFWTFSDPLGDATLLLTGTKTANARLSLSVPAGVRHDLFTGRNSAPRLLQPASNTDFTLEVKFDSPVSQAYQLQGVLIQQSPLVVLRFDFSSDGTATKAFAASTTNGFATDPVTQIPLTTVAGNNVAPLYMRIQRSGGTWTMFTSTNGTSYSPVGSFSYALTVSQVGAFAANGGSTIPAHTALIDYFFDTILPIAPEDGGAVADSVPPLVYNLLSVAGGNDIRVTWKTDERSKSRFDYGKTTSYGTIINDDTLRTNHTVMLKALQNNTTYNFRIIATDSIGKKDTTANIKDTTYAKTPTVVTFWYGNNAIFGKIGTPQRCVNILGNVTDPVGIDSVYYRLNGGAPVMLSLGPDSRRLQRPGDFNIDIPYGVLPPGASTLVLTTKNTFGERKDSTITVRDSSKAVWPLPYAVAMTSAKSLTDSVQIVDGRWAVNSGFAQIAERGYDRLIAIGDTTWKDYEITAKLKVTGMDSSFVAYSSPSNGPAIAFLMRWVGHTNNPVPGMQPLEGYLPLGAFAALSWTTVNAQKWELFGNNLVLKDTKTSPFLEFDTLYYFKMQVTTIPGQGGFYRFKAWKASQQEPSVWMLNAQESLADPQNGSVLLVAHHVSCSVDHVSVTALPLDQTPPSLGSIETEISATSAYITLTTDEPARVRVNFGRTSAYGETAPLDTVLKLSHGIPIVGLNPGTTYHYSIIAADTRGNNITTLDATFTTPAPGPASTLVTDEFNATSLNPRWTFANPLGDASLATPDSAVTISVPSGTVHDIWTGGYGVPRILQAANNADFAAEVKWNSAIAGTSTEYRMQGIVAQQDPNNLIRFDYTSSPFGTYIFAATFHDGFAIDSIRIRTYTLVPGGAGIQPLFMRIAREGNLWSQWYSTTGSAWVLATRFYHPFVLAGVGLFGGNSGSAPPAYASIADYFRVTATPSGVETPPDLPAIFALEQNYPNPFNPASMIGYQVPVASTVRLVVYDLLGREVAELVNERKVAGRYETQFNARNLASGVYLYRLTAMNFVQTRKMLVIK